MSNEAFFDVLSEHITSESDFTGLACDPEAPINIIAVSRYQEADSDVHKEIQFTLSATAKYINNQFIFDMDTCGAYFPTRIDENISIVYIAPMGKFPMGTDSYEIFDGDTRLAQLYQLPNTHDYIMTLPSDKPMSLYIHEHHQLAHRNHMYMAMNRAKQLIQNQTPLTREALLSAASDPELEAMGIRHQFHLGDGAISDLRREISNEMEQMQDHQNHALRLATVMQEKSLRLAKLEETPNLIDLRELSHPLIESVLSRKIEGSNRDLWNIEFTTKHVPMRPDANPDDFDVPEEGILLAPMTIIVTPRPGRRGTPAVTFKSVDPTTRRPGYSNSRTCHPHVFGSPLTACFGSFGDAITTSLSEGNYDVFMDVVMIFLQQANNGDPAGRTWVNWLTEEQRRPAAQPTDEERTIGSVVEISCATCSNNTYNPAHEGVICAIASSTGCNNFADWENAHRPPIPVVQRTVECDTCHWNENSWNDDADEDMCDHCEDYNNHEYSEEAA